MQLEKLKMLLDPPPTANFEILAFSLKIHPITCNFKTLNKLSRCSRQSVKYCTFLLHNF